MAMFPLPMERETISSLIIRGTRMYGITNQDFCRYFLESKNPNNIVGEAKLAGAVHRALGDRITLWEILKEHTCFKYTTALLSRIEKAEMAEWIRQRSHCGSIVPILSGKVGSNDLRWRPVRFCPECVREQEDEFGTSWWRTEWQIPGLELCLKHGCKLMSCGIKRPPPQALPSDISMEDCREADFGIKRPEDFAEGAATLFEKLPEIDNIKHIGLIDKLLSTNSVEHQLTELNYGTVKVLIIDEMGLRVITPNPRKINM